MKHNTNRKESPRADQHAAINSLWAAEAKATVVLAFRNGPIENVHASGRITEEEMKEINKFAVNRLYQLISLKRRSKKAWMNAMDHGLRYARNWDDPEELQGALEESGDNT